MSNPEVFLFDDFFVSNDQSDPGELVHVEMRGRQVPIYLKRGLSLEDREAAKAASIKIKYKNNGQAEIVNADEGAFAIELLVRCLKSWPFKYADGRKVAITRENIKAMLSDAADALSLLVINRMKQQTEAKKDFLPPSENS